MTLSRGVLATVGSIAGALIGRFTVRFLGFPGFGVLGCIAGSIAGYLISRMLMEIRAQDPR